MLILEYHIIRLVPNLRFNRLKIWLIPVINLNCTKNDRCDTSAKISTTPKTYVLIV